MFQYSVKKNLIKYAVFPLEPYVHPFHPVALLSSFILLLYNSLTLECTPMPVTSLSPCTQATVWAYAELMGGRRKVEQNVRMRYSQ